MYLREEWHKQWFGTWAQQWLHARCVKHTCTTRKLITCDISEIRPIPRSFSGYVTKIWSELGTGRHQIRLKVPRHNQVWYLATYCSRAIQITSFCIATIDCMVSKLLLHCPIHVLQQKMALALLLFKCWCKLIRTLKFELQTTAGSTIVSSWIATDKAMSKE